jgi:hypothetical protein
VSFESTAAKNNPIETLRAARMSNSVLLMWNCSVKGSNALRAGTLVRQSRLIGARGGRKELRFHRLPALLATITSYPQAPQCKQDCGPIKPHARTVKNLRAEAMAG